MTHRIAEQQFLWLTVWMVTSLGLPVVMFVWL